MAWKGFATERASVIRLASPVEATIAPSGSTTATETLWMDSTVFPRTRTTVSDIGGKRYQIWMGVLGAGCWVLEKV